MTKGGSMKTNTLQWMKKMIGLLATILLLTACAQGVEDSESFTGVIGKGEAIGYSYTVTKESSSFSWTIGYKEETKQIQETITNDEVLNRYRTAIHDSEATIVKLLITVGYLVILLVTVIIFYRKKREVLKGNSIIISVLASFALYIAIEAALDLNHSLQMMKQYYAFLTN